MIFFKYLGEMVCDEVEILSFLISFKFQVLKQEMVCFHIGSLVGDWFDFWFSEVGEDGDECYAGGYIGGDEVLYCLEAFLW